MRNLTETETQDVNGAWGLPAIMVAYTVGRVLHDFTCDDHDTSSDSSDSDG